MRGRVMLKLENEAQLPTEEELIERVRSGDRSAAKALFECHLRACHQAAYRILPNREEAQDAVQDGFLLAFRHFSRFQGRAPFRSWLRRIVVNVAFRRLRACANRRPLSLEQLPLVDCRPALAAAAFDPYEQAARREAISLVLAPLGSAGPPHARLIRRPPPLLLLPHEADCEEPHAGRPNRPRAPSVPARRLIRNRSGRAAWLTLALGKRYK